jgi:DNA-binding NtrC family response regulator
MVAATSVADASPPWTLAGRRVVVADPAMKRVFDRIARLAGSDLPVLITGETGVGKEIAAAALHAWSPRRGERMVAINCAALPDTLLESELFGYERGAFSGAVTSRPGHLELAAGGTVFLDEIGECSPRAQAKLLRALETRRVTRLGSSVERPVDLRVVTADSRSLEDEVAAGRFRQDLLYRLAAATVVVPALRERPLDLAPLGCLFLAEARAHLGRPPLAISPDTARRLARHAWPGNVRELKNLMDYLAVTVDDGPVEPEHLPGCLADAAPPRGAAPAPEGPAAPRAFRNIDDEIRELERRRMTEALEATGGIQTEAAALIGMPLRTFVTKRKRYAITTPGDHGRRPS